MGHLHLAFCRVRFAVIAVGFVAGHRHGVASPFTALRHIRIVGFFRSGAPSVIQPPHPAIATTLVAVALGLIVLL
jgi:hypothetical protein